VIIFVKAFFADKKIKAAKAAKEAGEDYQQVQRKQERILALYYLLPFLVSFAVLLSRIGTSVKRSYIPISYK
jgi:hypothetical protein